MCGVKLKAIGEPDKRGKIATKRSARARVDLRRKLGEGNCMHADLVHVLRSVGKEQSRFVDERERAGWK